MKNYKQTYRPVYTSKEKKKKYKPGKITFREDGPQSITQFVEIARKQLWKSEMNFFNGLVVYEWIRTRIIYDGFSLESSAQSKTCGINYNIAVAYIFKNLVGFDVSGIYWSKCWTRSLTSYVHEFFPDLKIGNPIEEDFKYPFKCMNLECLYFVKDMDERIDLLKHGDENEMTYAEFMDYVINYYKNKNEELGCDKYEYYFADYNPACIKKII